MTHMKQLTIDWLESPTEIPIPKFKKPDSVLIADIWITVPNEITNELMFNQWYKWKYRKIWNSPGFRKAYNNRKKQLNHANRLQ